MLSVVVPLHNEKQRFPDRCRVLKEYLDSLGEPWELLLVDDGSSDGTFEWIQGEAAADPRVRALRLDRNLGQGAAIKLGMLASRGDVALYTDADLAVSLSGIPALIARVRSGCDVAVAARWVQGARIGVPEPGLRRSMGKLFYLLIHLVLFDEVQDTNCGLKAYRGEAARMVFGFVRSWRWAFNVEHLWLARRFGYTIAEVPTQWDHQEGTHVHIFKDCLFTLWEVGMIKLRQFFGIYPQPQLT